jgi:hypothetical protein
MRQRCFSSVKIATIHVKTVLDLIKTNVLNVVLTMSAVLLRTEFLIWEPVLVQMDSQIQMATVFKDVSLTWLEEEEIFVILSVHRIHTHS